MEPRMKVQKDLASKNNTSAPELESFPQINHTFLENPNSIHIQAAIQQNYLSVDPPTFNTLDYG